jgi:hypothetical protein
VVIIMGLSKSKNNAKEPDKFFEWQRWKEQKRIEKRKKKLNSENRRLAAKEPALPNNVGIVPPSSSVPVPQPPSSALSFDDETLELMRFQLRNDVDAFLLNNILLSVQFFENYERLVLYF